MMDPARILSTARGGLERELLRSARTDRASDEVRARVLRSVTEVLASSAALTAAAANSGASAAARAGAGSARAGLGSSTASRFLGGLSLRAVCVGALLVAGIGVGLTLNHPGEREGSPAHAGSRSQEGQPGDDKPSGVEPAPGAPASLLEASAGRATPGALANTGAHASGAEYPSERTRTDETEPAESTSSADTDTKEIPPDWLGEQLQLLREARGHLESGHMERAVELLDGYEQRFPGGVIGPQIKALRAELRQQGSSQRAVP